MKDMTNMETDNNKVNFEDFELDFFNIPLGATEEDDEEYCYDRSDALEEMQLIVPQSASLLGHFEDEVDNWTSWETDNFYYVMPWEGDQFQWCLFRISWDDNWGRYNWESCARINHQEDCYAAAKIMLGAQFAKWGYDLSRPENAAYAKFLNNL